MCQKEVETDDHTEKKNINEKTADQLLTVSPQIKYFFTTIQHILKIYELL